jgi:hypothetical protein
MVSSCVNGDHLNPNCGVLPSALCNGCIAAFAEALFNGIFAELEFQIDFLRNIYYLIHMAISANILRQAISNRIGRFTIGSPAVRHTDRYGYYCRG